jgi:hypothetical protein
MDYESTALTVELQAHHFGSEKGIRTLVPLAEPTDFQSVPIDQLWHLTMFGGECGNRTHSPISERQISNLLHYHPAHSPVWRKR